MTTAKGPTAKDSGIHTYGSFFRLFIITFVAFLFASLLFLGGGFCYSVLSSRRYTPPALIASLNYAYSPCVLSSFFFLLCCVADVDLSFFFLLFLPIFDFDLDIVCFHPVFFLWVLCCLLGLGFCCDSFSI